MNIDDAVLKLLEYMNNILEENGLTPEAITFSFEQAREEHYFNAPSKKIPDDENRRELKEHYQLSDDDIDAALNKARSRQWIKGHGLHHIWLTNDGRDYLLASQYHNTHTTLPSQQINIAHNEGAVQIGNNNTQNISIVFEQLIKDIDNSTASPEDKKEVKGLLKQFLEHPVMSSIISGTTVAGIRHLLGI